MNPLTRRAGQSVNLNCTPETSFWLQAVPCPMFDLSPPETAEKWPGKGQGAGE